jgi:hypothetical protein
LLQGVQEGAEVTLPPVLYRRPNESGLAASEYLIYRCFIKHLDAPTSPARAILRAATECGVSRRRVLAIVRQVNPEAMP